MRLSGWPIRYALSSICFRLSHKITKKRDGLADHLFCFYRLPCLLVATTAVAAVATLVVTATATALTAAAAAL